MSSAPAQPLTPLSIRRDGNDRLAVEWNDGHRSTYTWKHLRHNCPCAGCKGESGQPPDPFRILTASELAPKPPLQPVAMEPVGHYAYKIVWNDGHDTGLYTLENLRALCECDQCRPRA
jgi:DUF971 family protein